MKSLAVGTSVSGNSFQELEQVVAAYFCLLDDAKKRASIQSTVTRHNRHYRPVSQTLLDFHVAASLSFHSKSGFGERLEKLLAGQDW